MLAPFVAASWTASNGSSDLGTRTTRRSATSAVVGPPSNPRLFAIDAPWNKSEEVVNYIREVNPQHTIDVHNGILSPAGEMLYGKTIETLVKPEHAHLAVGGDITL